MFLVDLADIGHENERNLYSQMDNLNLLNQKDLQTKQFGNERVVVAVGIGIHRVGGVVVVGVIHDNFEFAHIHRDMLVPEIAAVVVVVAVGAVADAAPNEASGLGIEHYIGRHSTNNSESQFPEEVWAGKAQMKSTDKSWSWFLEKIDSF